MSVERWAVVNIPRCDDFIIEVSSLGYVKKTFKRTGNITILNGTVVSGFRNVSIHSRPYAVHKLVAQAFVPNPEKLSKIIHKNGDKLDNRAENLMWSDHFIRRDSSRATDNRKKLSCPELNKVFGSLRSAAYITQIPQDIISWSMSAGVRVCGLTFNWIEPSCEATQAPTADYVSFDDMCELAKNSCSIEDLQSSIKEKIANDKRKEDCT